MKNNYDRFSETVKDYIKYRPGYPDSMLTALDERIDLSKIKNIADIGSGTGLSSKPFLNQLMKVFAVEPNDEMRKAAESIFKDNNNFISVKGDSVNTNLPDKSVDLIFCGQSFHWFDLKKTKLEFNRILKSEGHIVLAWNERDIESPLQNEYESILLDNIQEYRFVNHKLISDVVVGEFLQPKTITTVELENLQYFDLQGLKGRANSSSYMPKSGQLHDKIMRLLERLFQKYAVEEMVEFRYKTKIYIA